MILIPQLVFSIICIAIACFILNAPVAKTTFKMVFVLLLICAVAYLIGDANNPLYYYRTYSF